jgi:hypothetical protein
MSKLNYLHLTPASALPVLEHLAHFKAIIVIEADLLETQMWDISRWLIASGCLYARTWGKDAEAWRAAHEDAAL